MFNTFSTSNKAWANKDRDFTALHLGIVIGRHALLITALSFIKFLYLQVIQFAQRMLNFKATCSVNGFWLKFLRTLHCHSIDITCKLLQLHAYLIAADPLYFFSYSLNYDNLITEYCSLNTSLISSRYDAEFAHTRTHLIYQK